MKKRRKSKISETTRNAFLVLLVVGLIVIFFKLDFIRGGKTLFNRTRLSTIRFSGDLQKEDYSKKETDRLLKYIKRYKSFIKSITVDSRVQDSYKKMKDSSPVTFELHMALTDGGTISTPTKRTTRQRLVHEIIQKIGKDIRVYKEMIKDGDTPKSLLNTS